MHPNLSCCAAAIVALVAGAALQPGPSFADGALAVGQSDSVARDGFASGYRINAPDMDTARKGAIAGCQKSVGASDKAKKLCKVVATFRNQCLAIAIDPKDGTPGVGWSIAESQDMADKQAMEQCRSTAGAARRQFCEIMKDRGVNRGCDGNAK